MYVQCAIGTWYPFRFRLKGTSTNPDLPYTYIAFDELPDENWAIAGKLLDEE